MFYQYKRPRVFPLLLAVLALRMSPASAQPTNPPAHTTSFSFPTNDMASGKVPLPMLKVISEEDVFNAVTSPLLQTFLQSDNTNALVGFINDLHLRPKFFHTSGGASDGVFGFEYDFEKSIVNRTLNETSKNPMGLSLTFNARGDVAFNASENPNNFLETGGVIHLFQGIGGIDPTFENTPEQGRALQDALMKNITNDDFKHQRGPAYEALARQMTEYITPQFFWDLQGHGTLEADQQFHNKQWTYGGKLAFVFRDWRNNSPAAWFNIFDYPFAAIRWLVDKEDFQPSGRAFPSVVLGTDLVDPSMDKTRLALDPDTSPYPRGRVEVAFKTRVLHWQTQKLYFSAAFRYFQEFGASTAIKTANLDHSDYFVAKLDLPYRFNISFTNGKLPMDVKNDQVYAIGWALNF
jgi:hypothetical protein